MTDKSDALARSVLAKRPNKLLSEWDFGLLSGCLIVTSFVAGTFVILGIEQGDLKKNVIIGIVGLLMAFFQGFVLFTQYRRARKASGYSPGGDARRPAESISR
jgi:hypothetical protein